MNLSFARGPAEFACPLEAPVDCSIAVNPYADVCKQSRTFGLARAIASNVCVVSSGAPVNCVGVSFCAHSSGTHTECIGHVTLEHTTLRDVASLPAPPMPALLVTVAPAALGAAPAAESGGPNAAPDDLVVSAAAFRDAVAALGLAPGVAEGVRAVVLRTSPHYARKTDYTGTNPPYLTEEFAKGIVAAFPKFTHLVVELPSVDREDDGGTLLSHRAVFSDPNNTITELAKLPVPADLPDGVVVLDLQVPPIDMDAAPSRPVLYACTATASA